MSKRTRRLSSTRIDKLLKSKSKPTVAERFKRLKRYRDTSDNDKYDLSKGKFYCHSCGRMKDVQQKVEFFEDGILNGKVSKYLRKVECFDCAISRRLNKK